MVKLDGKSYDLGLKLFNVIRNYDKYGMGKQYESNDSIRNIRFHRDNIEGVEELCKVMGACYVSDGTWYDLIGRRSMLETVAVAVQDFDVYSPSVWRGFYSEASIPYTPARMASLERVRAIMTNPLKLAHKVAELYPACRVWNRITTGAEITLKRRWGNYIADGVAFELFGLDEPVNSM